MPKYVELENGGAVSVADICAVTCRETREAGQSWGCETWEVTAHLRSGTPLTLVRVTAEPSDKGEGKAANARARGQAEHFTRSIRSMMLDQGPDSRLSPVFGELVDLCGQVIDTEGDRGPHWVTIFPEPDGGYRVEWDENAGEHHRQTGFRDVATAEAFAEALEGILEGDEVQS